MTGYRTFKQNTVLASVSKSFLWKNAEVYTLSINIRLREEDKDFAKWILKVGDGDADTEGDQIVVNKEFMISKSDKPHEAQADAAYPNFVHYCRNKK
ncbi:unnamed protein product [Brassica oleracea]|uniref:ATP-dependent DNA helicase n=2 Tax=Brassica TaxID=3705 RepID=A0A816JI97_BRANA|nr:unnamed protein product [Brassica napus]VDD10094.1 unnamed protein product [Brassica oleracea]